MQCTCRFEVMEEPYPFQETRVEGVVLVGLERKKCGRCGADDLRIPRMGQLLRLLAYSVVARPGRLAPPEISKLRADLLFQQGEFASMLGVSQPVLCRWETGKRRPSRISDVALRLAFLTMPPRNGRFPWEAPVQERLSPLLGPLVHLARPRSWPIRFDVRRSPQDLIEEVVYRARKTVASGTAEATPDVTSAGISVQ
ncbi:MAG TPA: helix-turn-helix domain-containing protein [Acidobacteriota bacterium]|nr:helix-turn-helix domain-containing protein [Acidobacteriota bacterium]